MTTQNPPSGVSGLEANTKDELKNVQHFDIIAGHLHGANKKSTSSLEMAIFKGNRSPLSGVDLGQIGAEFDMQFSVNPNPKEGFNIHIADGRESADELTQYQVMKGGYDGKKKFLIHYHRPFVPALNDPYVSITFFQKEMAIDKLCGPLPDNIKPGTLMEWRENGWREEAKKILRSVNAYNPITQEVARIERKYNPVDITEDPNKNFELKDEDQLVFREDEIIEAVLTPVQNLPKIRYLENFFRCLGEVKNALGFA